MSLNAVGMASETVDVGNYSFTFNMTVPHQITAMHAKQTSEIKTFDGHVLLDDYTGLNMRSYIPGETLLGLIDKDIGYGSIYAHQSDSGLGDRLFILGFENNNSLEATTTAYVVSSMNFTQSADFFKDLKIKKLEQPVRQA